MRSIACSNLGVTVGSTNLVNSTKESLSIFFNTRDNKSVPQGIKLVPPVVQDSCEPSVESFWLESEAIISTFFINSV